ncbi:MAG: serine/threonine protein kinase [Nitrospirae bacterium]|nr:MAG: serine/threonine protein kinase [Nitrospirota bacterium]
MAQRLIDILRTLAKELIEKGYDSEDALRRVEVIDIDFSTVREELNMLEINKYIDESELDTIRALLAYILMKDTDLESEDIYAYTFGRGRQIIWN